MYILPTILPTILPRDNYMDDQTSYGSSVFALIAILLVIGCTVGALLHLRRRRLHRMALRHSDVPTSHRLGHHRTLTITSTPSLHKGDSIFVYDEKMNLIANSTGPPQSPIPEIHVTFPEEEVRAGQTQAGRVVILRISDTGSVGMEPLNQETLPPYQRNDAGRFQSLDLERIGGLKEKEPVTTQRWS